MKLPEQQNETNIIWDLHSLSPNIRSDTVLHLKSTLENKEASTDMEYSDKKLHFSRCFVRTVRGNEYSTSQLRLILKLVIDWSVRVNKRNQKWHRCAENRNDVVLGLTNTVGNWWISICYRTYSEDKCSESTSIRNYVFSEPKARKMTYIYMRRL